MKRVLVATDGSDHAAKALALATELATKFEAELLILHVVTDNPLSERERALVETEYAGEMRARLDERDPAAEAGLSVHRLLAQETATAALVRNLIGERLLAEAETSARSGGVRSVHAILAHGDPARTILSVADENGADAIVMGSRGFGELRSLLLGSVSHKIAHVAHCTVITVR